MTQVFQDIIVCGRLMGLEKDTTGTEITVFQISLPEIDSSGLARCCFAWPSRLTAGCRRVKGVTRAGRIEKSPGTGCRGDLKSGVLLAGDKLGENDPVIAPTRTSMRFFAREHTHATGGAGRIGTAGGFKTDPISTQLIQVLSLYDPVSRKTCNRWCVFIGHD